MKQLMQKMLCLMLALMLSFSLFSIASASEALIGQKTKDGHTILSVQYVDSETGSAYLYGEDGQTIVAILTNGTKLAVTDGQKGDLVFVQEGATSGWINEADLQEELPQNVTGALSGSSAPAQAFTPVETLPPATADAPEETADADTADETLSDESDEEETTEDTTADSETIGDPEKDHPAIAALYDDGEAGSETVAVDVVQLGVVTSIIVLEDQRQEVDTSLLTFGEEIPAEQKLGYVHAPRTGQAGLRETPAKDGKVITQLKAGQLAVVLSMEENYAHVNVKGVEGWLRLDCLKYLAATDEGIVSSADLSALGMGKKPAGQKEAASETGTDDPDTTTTNADEDAADKAAAEKADVIITDNNGQIVDTAITFPSTAILSCKGETDGTTSVNLRNLPTKDSAKAAVLRTGVEVTVLSELEGWYLVEADGVCGFVMEAFLSMEG